MKYTLVVFIALLFAGCKSNDIEFNGVAPGLSSGTIIIKDAANNPVYTANIEAGKFHINKQRLTLPGYYDFVILLGSVAKPYKFDIYLEPGTYTIKLDKDKLNNYPVINSTSSAIQNQTTAYYTLADGMTNDLRQTVRDLHIKLNGPEARTSLDVYNELAAKLQATKRQIANENIKALSQFVDRNPENIVAPHLMVKLNYMDAPEDFNKVYQKLSAAAKNTDEGKEIGSKLDGMTKLAAGAPAPPIVGTTPDGKPVDLRAMHKKIILVEFWRSDSELSRKCHEAMVLNPLPGGNNLGIVSVSFDTKRDVWLKTIKDEKLSWTQVSDLQGNDSPNVNNWGVTSVPLYCLIDDKGNLIERDLSFSNLAFLISNYLEHH
jgi:hypothetical protein